jgi:hypothetical protein
MTSANDIPSVTVATPFAARLAHLDLDLRDTNRPAVVSAVLQACLQGPEGEPLSWQQLHNTDIAQRLQWLLAVVQQSGVQQLALTCRCPACEVEIALDLDAAMFNLPAPPNRFDCEPQPGVRLRLRLPTGADQSRWAATGALNFTELAGDLVLAVERGAQTVAATDRGVATDSDPADPVGIDPVWLPEIEAALEDADPLNALQVDTRCPDCGHAFALAIDLEQQLLQALMTEQARVLIEIHRLASVYHWREQEILDLSPARRCFYLRCIVREGA